MTLVAWYPEGMQAPIELTAVMIRPGVVTQRDWLKALSDRVENMALASENPERATEMACRLLGLPMTSDPENAGQYLVDGNWNLKTHFNLAVIDEDPFPARVRERDPEAMEAIQETDLETWAELALSMVSESSLD